jgi:hypothetical protein
VLIFKGQSIYLEQSLWGFNNYPQLLWEFSTAFRAVIPRLSSSYPQFEQVYAQVFRKYRHIFKRQIKDTKSIKIENNTVSLGKQAYFSLFF